MTALAIVCAYLLGSVPFALVAARLKGVDLRHYGSGNLGATNAIRVLGAAYGVPVLLADIAKGFVAVAVIPRLFGPTEGSLPLVCGVFAIAGHVSSIFLRFRGGKGVATAAGAFLALAPRSMGVAVVVFLVVLGATRFVSLASICAAIALPVALWATRAPGAILAVGVVIALVVILKHRSNVSRLLAGTENRIRFGRSGRGAS